MAHPDLYRTYIGSLLKYLQSWDTLLLYLILYVENAVLFIHELFYMYHSIIIFRLLIFK
jgi:hypothetical protein